MLREANVRSETLKLSDDLNAGKWEVAPVLCDALMEDFGDKTGFLVFLFRTLFVLDSRCVVAPGQDLIRITFDEEEIKLVAMADLYDGEAPLFDPLTGKTYKTVKEVFCTRLGARCVEKPQAQGNVDNGEAFTFAQFHFTEGFSMALTMKEFADTFSIRFDRTSVMAGRTPPGE